MREKRPKYDGVVPIPTTQTNVRLSVILIDDLEEVCRRRRWKKKAALEMAVEWFIDRELDKIWDEDRVDPVKSAARAYHEASQVRVQEKQAERALAAYQARIMDALLS